MNLVTGATGLLGAHVMLELLKRGEKVRGLRRKESQLIFVKEIFDLYPETGHLFDEIEWCEGDVLEIDSLFDAISDCTNVYHCAAVVSYHADDRDAMYLVNVEGTANVVNVSLEKKINRLCFVSSIAALGKSKPNDVLNENAEWIDSAYNTHYGITKNLSEMEVWRGIQEGLDAIVVNPGFIIGPGNFDRSSATVFRKIDEGLSYFPPGGTGFVGVQDCASMMVDLMKKSAGGERFILVAENLTMQEVFTDIASGLSKPLPTKEATPTIMNIARYAEWVKEKLTGRKALVTKESVKNASIRFFYENKKVVEILGRGFAPVGESISSTARFFKKKNQRV